VELAGDEMARASKSPWALRIALWVLAAALCVLGPNGRVLASIPQHLTGGVASAEPAGPDVAFEPMNGATDVMPDTVVTATARGVIQEVTLIDSTGATVPGQTDLNARVWRSTAALNPGRGYTLNVTSVEGGKHVRHSASAFSTVPGKLMSASLLPGDGQTVGVGMPVVVRFSAPVKNQDVILEGFSVTAASGTEIRAKWFSPYELHFRPQSYWKTGEKVSVSMHLDGLDAGNNVFGSGSKQMTFTVGAAHVSLVDVNTHVMTVSENGNQVRSMLISAGRPKYPTMNGVHFVWGKAANLIMDSSTVGIPRNSPDGYYEKVQWNVQITTGGEYVHSAPWSVASQGQNNVSHGCVNASPTDAKWFYGFTQMGDIVQVTGSPRPPTAKDGSADWNTGWNEWIPQPAPAPAVLNDAQAPRTVG
jgi:lipoprotein-anchoring transpeptidase ErfK/SrfK